MGVISGIGAAVDGVSTLAEWSISSSADLQARAASNTKGGTVVLAGNKDWNGTYRANGHTPARSPGESFTFTGTIDGTNGATGTARVSQVEITIDIEGGRVIEHVVTFEADGELTLGAAAATDTSEVEMPSSIGVIVELADPALEPSWSELDDVRTVTITLAANNQSYVSSSTGGQTRRTEGNLTGTVAITLYSDDFGELPRENDVKGVRVRVEDGQEAKHWLLDWIRFGEASDLNPNREEATVTPASLNGQWTAFADIDGTMTEGKIEKPDGNEVWPDDA